MTKKPTRAEVLAEYLGLGEKTHPAWYFSRYECSSCGQDVASEWGYKCPSCTGSKTNRTSVLRLPDPLAPGTAADAWGPVIDAWFMQYQPGCLITYDRGVCGVSMPLLGEFVWDESPTAARVRAMMAADSTFREKMEGATP